MATFEYNWATAEMVKLYLRNSRAQKKRKSRMANGPNTNTPANSVHTGAVETDAGLFGAVIDSEDDDSDDDSDED